MNSSHVSSIAPTISFGAQAPRPTLVTASHAPHAGELELRLVQPTTESTAESDRDEAVWTVVDRLRLHTGRAILVSEVLLPSGYTSAAISISNRNTDEIVIPLKLIPRIAHDLLAVYTRAHARPMVPRAQPANAEPSPPPAPPAEPVPVVAKASPPVAASANYVPPLSPVERRAREHVEIARVPGVPKGRTAPR
jgi:hypothetical protein